MVALDKTWKKAVAIIFLTVLSIVLAYIAFSASPAPTNTFTPNGGHIGDFQIGGTYYNAFQIVFGDQIDESWVKTMTMVQYLILPFAAVWILVYAIFDEITFFKRITWFNPAMALITAFIVASTGWLVRMMRGYLMLAGGLGIIFFGVILFAGLVFWFLGRMGSFGLKFGGAVQEYKEIGNIEAALRREMAYANSIEGSHPQKAADIKSLVALAQDELGKDSPNLGAARARLNDCQKKH